MDTVLRQLEEIGGQDNGYFHVPCYSQGLLLWFTFETPCCRCKSLKSPSSFKSSSRYKGFCQIIYVLACQTHKLYKRFPFQRLRLWTPTTHTHHTHCCLTLSTIIFPTISSVVFLCLTLLALTARVKKYVCNSLQVIFELIYAWLA